MTTKIEDIWTCSECGTIQGRHDQWFDGICEDCHENKNRFICGVCGDHVPKVTFNEDKDIDECDNCKE